MKLPRIQRQLTSILVRSGDLLLNQLPSPTPPEFSNLTAENFYVGVTPSVTPANPTPAFTTLDAGPLAASNYDELVIDPQPQIDVSGNVTTNTRADTYRQLLEAGTPFWFLVRCTGYGVASQQKRDAALALAGRVVASLWADATAFMLSPLLKGFAFLSPDLNVVFPDGTAIDRAFQSTLVQYAWSVFRAATIVTARPADAITLVSPVIQYNPNSGKPLAHPILGTSPQFRDRLLAMYPNVAVAEPNISTIVSQVSSFYAAAGRDSGFPLNLDFGYVAPVDYTQWTPDGVVGVGATAPGADAVLSRIFNFLGALGVDSVGLVSGPTGALVPAPQDFFPPDGSVNTTGGAVVWSSGGTVYVRYVDLARAVVTMRAFSQTFEEHAV